MLDTKTTLVEETILIQVLHITGISEINPTCHYENSDRTNFYGKRSKYVLSRYTYLTAWCRIFHDKLKVPHPEEKNPHFMQPGGSLLNSQGPTTSLCPEPKQFNPFVHPGSWRIILILSSHLRLDLPNCLIPSDFLTKTLYAPFCHTCYNALPVSSYLISSPKEYLVRSRDNNAPAHNSLCKIAFG